MDKYGYLWFDMENFEKDFGVKRIENGWSDDVIRPKQFIRTCLYALARQSIGDCAGATVVTGKIKVYSPINRFHTDMGEPVEIRLEYFFMEQEAELFARGVTNKVNLMVVRVMEMRLRL